MFCIWKDILLKEYRKYLIIVKSVAVEKVSQHVYKEVLACFKKVSPHVYKEVIGCFITNQPPQLNFYERLCMGIIYVYNIHVLYIRTRSCMGIIYIACVYYIWSCMGIGYIASMRTKRAALKS